METELPALEVSADPIGPEVVVTFELAAASKPAAGHLERAFQAFVGVGQRGGFVKDRADPRHTIVTVTAPFTDRNHALSCRLGMEGITGRAFQLLRHMAAAFNREGVEILRITVADKRGEQSLPRVPAVKDENEDLVYPVATPNPGFDLVHEEIPASRMRRCLIQPALTPDESLGAVEEWIRPWFGLLELGAFTPPVAEPDFGQSLAGGVQIFDEATIEILVDRFEASENAWNVLVNVLAALHRGKVPLRSMTIA